MDVTTVSPNISAIDLLSKIYLIITPEQYLVYLKAIVGISIVIGLGGIIGNIINIRTFYVLGLKDGVTVSFFALSITDLLSLTGIFLMRVFSILTIMEIQGTRWFTMHPHVLGTFVGNVAFICGNMSMISITFVGVARCLCVAMPLKFKNMFTKSRSIAIIACFSLLPVIAWCPIFAHMGTQRRFDVMRNATRIFVWVSSDREKIKSIVYLLFDTIIPLIVEVVLIACVVIMTYKLRESAKFRSSHGNQGDEQKKESASTKLSQQERRVVQQVIVISGVFLFANLLRIFNPIYSIIQPEFDVNRRYHYFYYMMVGIRIFFEGINSSINVFVYYYYNSSFRAVVNGSWDKSKI